MALNVLIVPEDFRPDQYVLKPIIERMLERLEVKAKVRVCMNPLLGGVGEALKRERVEEIIGLYPMVQVFLWIVDRDCDEGRRRRLDDLEVWARPILGSRHLFTTDAWQEVEVWALAGQRDLPAEWSWAALRATCHPKEEYYLPYANRRALSMAPYQGREVLGREAASRYDRIRQLCPQDVGTLEQRLREVLTR